MCLQYILSNISESVRHHVAYITEPDEACLQAMPTAAWLKRRQGCRLCRFSVYPYCAGYCGRHCWCLACTGTTVLSKLFLSLKRRCEPRQRSQYSDWLLAKRPRGRSSSPGGGKNFHFSMSPRPALGFTQPPIEWELGALSPGVKRPGREADHSPTTSAEVKKLWIYTSTPPYAFMV
jgi:hypothetical protein